MVKRIRDMMVVIGCVAGMVACQREEIIPQYNTGERILFGVPMLTVESGSRSMLKDALKAGDEFGVMGYCVPYTVGTDNLNYDEATSNWETKKSMCAPVVFDKQKVSIGASGCVYVRSNGTGTNDPKWWYKEGRGLDGESNLNVKADADGYQYAFFAYYPYEEAFTVSLAAEDKTTGGDNPQPLKDRGAPIFQFDMPFEGGDVATSLTKDVPDAMLAAVYAHQSGDGNVRFNFSHLLTGLTFDVHNFSDDKVLKVYSIELVGEFWRSIKVDLSGRSPVITFPEETYKGVYEIFRDDIGKDIPVSVDGTDVEPITDKFLLLVPGPDETKGYLGPNSSNNGVKVRIHYEFDGAERTEEIPRPGTFIPRSGTKYTAQLNFVGDAFVLQFVVDNDEQWKDGEADDGNEDNDDVLFE